MVALSDQPGAGSGGAGQLRVLATPDRAIGAPELPLRAQPAIAKRAQLRSAPRATARGRGAPATKKSSCNGGTRRHRRQAPGGWVSQRSTQPAPRRSLRCVALDLVGGVGLQLAVVLHADLVEQVELGLDEVDVVLLVPQEFLEQVHGDEVLLDAAQIARTHVEVAGDVFHL